MSLWPQKGLRTYVWQKAHQLVLEIYKITKQYPSEERFELVSQMRAAAVSIPANIAEGFKKRSAKEKAKFYNISQGSLEESFFYEFSAVKTKNMPVFQKCSPHFLISEMRKCVNISEILTTVLRIL